MQSHYLYGIIHVVNSSSHNVNSSKLYTLHSCTICTLWHKFLNRYRTFNNHHFFFKCTSPVQQLFLSFNYYPSSLSCQFCVVEWWQIFFNPPDNYRKSFKLPKTCYYLCYWFTVYFRSSLISINLYSLNKSDNYWRFSTSWVDVQYVVSMMFCFLIE